MAMQYKPTKQKKEKPAKAPKAPKPEKLVKMGGAVKVKTSKPAKPPKQPKAPKPEKAQSFAPTFKGGKVAKAADLEKKSVLKKTVNPIIAVSVVVALIVVAVLVVVLIVPAMQHHGEEIKEISISQLPDKTVYLQGEEADYKGLRVKVTKNNGETFILRASDCTFSGFSSKLPIETMYVTVEYQGFTSSFSVKVLEHVKPTPVLDSIYLDPMPKTEYKVNEWLDTEGGVLVRKYKDGSTVEVSLTPDLVFGWGTTVAGKGPGTYTLTVKYAENGVLCTFDYEITVTE